MNNADKKNELNNILGELSRYKNIDQMPSFRIVEVLKKHIKKIPKFLYKYYPCESNRMKAVSNCKIWASRGNTFEANDALLEFDKRKLLKYVYNEKELFLIDFARKDYNISEDTVNYYRRKCIDGNYRVNKQAENELLLKHPNTELSFLIQYLRYLRKEYSLASQYREQLNAIKYGARNSTDILCLTETNCNKSMWEQYADNYNGFCVEYSFENPYLDETQMRNLVSLNGVVYEDKIQFDPILLFPRLKVDKKIVGDDNIYLNAQLYYKKKKFSFEREWRIVFHPNRNDREINPNGNLYDFPFINKIYIGYRMDSTYKNELIQIAKNLFIPAEEITYDQNAQKHSYKVLTQMI